jgi:hypothetical protein
LSQGYIYVIDPHLQVKGRSVVKIGLTTRSPAKRLKEIQTSLPHAASMIHAAQFPDVKWAERHLHRALSSRNVKVKGGTEFFFLSPKDAVEIVNLLAYQVSVFEAKRALDRDLEQFINKISNKLSSKIAGLFSLAVFVGVLTFNARSAHSLNEYLSLAFGATVLAFILTLIAGVIGIVVGESAAKKIWKGAIAAERQRLLEKYPAAKKM